MEEENFRKVFPGDVLGVISDFQMGCGVYEDEGEIRSSILGTVTDIDMNQNDQSDEKPVLNVSELFLEHFFTFYFFPLSLSPYRYSQLTESL